jgi:hypothetical protein
MLSFGCRLWNARTPFPKVFCDHKGPCDDVMSLDHVRENFRNRPAELIARQCNTGITAFDTSVLILDMHWRARHFPRCRILPGRNPSADQLINIPIDHLMQLAAGSFVSLLRNEPRSHGRTHLRSHPHSPGPRAGPRLVDCMRSKQYRETATRRSVRVASRLDHDCF